MSTHQETNYPVHPITLDKDIWLFNVQVKDHHLVYEYDAKNPETGEPEKWKYEMWFVNHERIAYAIHGGPMAGRVNFQTAGFQCVRPNEIWQCNWLEETGSICSLVWDIPNGKLSTLIAFSKGHWDNPNGDALGDKRNDAHFRRWHELSKDGIQVDRCLLQEQANLLPDAEGHFMGPGNIKPFDQNQDTIVPPAGHTQLVYKN